MISIRNHRRGAVRVVSVSICCCPTHIPLMCSFLGGCGFLTELLQEEGKRRFFVTKNGCDRWKGIFGESNWQRVFLTYKKDWSRQRDKVKNALEKNAAAILSESPKNGLVADFGGKFALPGPVDPSGFKGLKGMTGGHYLE